MELSHKRTIEIIGGVLVMVLSLFLAVVVVGTLMAHDSPLQLWFVVTLGILSFVLWNVALFLFFRRHWWKIELALLVLAFIVTEFGVFGDIKLF